MPSLSQVHRPKRFSEVTGQHHITETLRQEIATGRLGHVFLFSGPRGVGKTTTARIFAKALNCESLVDGEPCTACARCQQAESGVTLDVIELDAATHNGVDSVRESIIEHVRFAPASGHRKVYILDEAHMLTTAAWNALLKTLEEPPTYAFFILATTELHKVPATILSRSQQFAFKRISDVDMAARLQDIVQKEGWSLTPEASTLIIQKADGCLRDAETLLGQIGGLGSKEITADIVGLVIPFGQRSYADALFASWLEEPFHQWYGRLQQYAEEGIAFLPLFDDLLLCIQDRLAEQAKAGTLTDLETLRSLALQIFERRRDVKMGMDPLFALQLVGLSIKQATSTATTIVPTPQPTVISKPSASEKLEKKEQPRELTTERKASHGVSLADVRARWQEIIRLVDEQNHSLPLILKTASPKAVEGDTVFISFTFPFHRDRVIGDGKHRAIVQQALRKALQNDALTVEGVVIEAVAVEGAQDVVGNILQAFGGSVVQS